MTFDLLIRPVHRVLIGCLLGRDSKFILCEFSIDFESAGNQIPRAQICWPYLCRSFASGSADDSKMPPEYSAELNLKASLDIADIAVRDECQIQGVAQEIRPSQTFYAGWHRFNA
jgi:hypothetical protein